MKPALSKAQARVRCAIYTRKSSEEGLEQDFNSLDAQREACAAYVLSQASEGWTLNAGVYDDGGISGGTLERPALQRLLADIAAGQIDIVVVYKVDRLTRSLLDFSKLVEAFDKAGTSFVSITQSFNTTTSMGRLTLNMLLSFAQFEREVTAERIRDKIAASKAKGMWMGGTVPIGYRKNERTLAIDADEAKFVRHLFARYLALGAVRALADELARQGITSPRRTYDSGRVSGGGKFTCGQLYYLLKNPVYIGRIRHKEQSYPGQHQGIVDQALWDAVQASLATNTQGEGRTRGPAPARPSSLAGKIFDEAGSPLIASHACKPVPSGAEGGKLRYRYYISQPDRDGNQIGATCRIPAKDIENAVTQRIAEALDDPLDLAIRLDASLGGCRIDLLNCASQELAGKMRTKDRATLDLLVTAVRVLPDEIAIELDAQALAQAIGLQAACDLAVITITSPVKLTRTGMAMRMVFEDGRVAGKAEASAQLIKLVLRARTWWGQIASGDHDRESLAREHKVVPSYVSRVLRLAFLSPVLVERILSGEHPARLDGGTLLAPGFPASWAEQERRFLQG